MADSKSLETKSGLLTAAFESAFDGRAFPVGEVGLLLRHLHRAFSMSGRIDSMEQLVSVTVTGTKGLRR